MQNFYVSTAAFKHQKETANVAIINKLIEIFIAKTDRQKNKTRI